MGKGLWKQIKSWWEDFSKFIGTEWEYAKRVKIRNVGGGL